MNNIIKTVYLPVKDKLIHLDNRPSSIDIFYKLMKKMSLKDNSIVCNNTDYTYRYIITDNFAIWYEYSNSNNASIKYICINKEKLHLLYLKDNNDKVHNMLDLINKMKMLDLESLNNSYFENIQIENGNKMVTLAHNSYDYMITFI